ncbi:MAG: DUF3119 family protein [Phormidesmis sp. RL_2_1]|nr:DUF3119 family protein [Phormidesmis sp. RL_2_1]
MTATSDAATSLTPSYRLPIGLVLIGLIVIALPLKTGGMGIILTILGFFLLYQSATIRLVFTDKALEVRRHSNLLKTFPYADWQTWTIFWPPVPILFYFKEINSIHFLPILFDATELHACLTAHCFERSV